MFVLCAFAICSFCRPAHHTAHGQQAQQANSIQVGGPCEGCEAAEKYGNRELTWSDTLEGFSAAGPKMAVSGTIYQAGGKTPAAGVILYVYHTDQTGHYPRRGDETGWGRRHGYLRTWLKTNEAGQYRFYTLRPAAYPGGGEPEHIHATIKEHGKSPYWIDDYLFDDDPLLTAARRSRLGGRGGDGVLSSGETTHGVTQYRRDITLGLNVTPYQ